MTIKKQTLEDLQNHISQWSDCQCSECGEQIENPTGVIWYMDLLERGEKNVGYIRFFCPKCENVEEEDFWLDVVD